MSPKKISNKIKIARKVLAERGFLGFLIVCLEFIQKKTRRQQNSTNPAKGAVYTKARYKDILNTRVYEKHKPWRGTTREKLRFNWVMPPPGKGSGGHLNIFRFIKYLEDAGHTCNIYMYVAGEHGPVSGVQAIMGDSYPEVTAAKSMRWLDDSTKMVEADGVFATSWETAYAIYAAKPDARLFYFVQDFEPYFYPAGSFYTFAENTYKLGFYGITAGGWLSKKLSEDFGMATSHYSFGCDTLTYNYQNNNERKEILFYVRPYTERRGFETGIMALDLFHKKHPDFTINLVGWDVSEYAIPFPYKNLKTLEITELNELYNRCAAGLVLSFTNMSLLPLELLGSGAIPVVNKADNNTLVSDNKYIAYAENDPTSLADALSTIVSRKDASNYARKAADSAKSESWEEAGRTFIKIVEKETRNG